MKAPITISERDLHTLLGIVSDSQQTSLPAAGLPWSVLSGLQDQIRCDVACFYGQIPSATAQPLADLGGSADEYLMPRQPADLGEVWVECDQNTDPQTMWVTQAVPVNPIQCEADEHTSTTEQGSECVACTYPDRTGDLRSVVKLSDFYSTRQLHSTAVYQGMRKSGIEHELILCLPHDSGRLKFWRESGPDFSERDRGLLALLRPHLHEAYLDAERRRHGQPQLTRRQWELLHLLAAGHTNTQIARRLGISAGTVRTHLENIYSRLQVSSRTAAVTRAFQDGATR
jgi:DNA-binding CsgD family transcriptional regulator